MNEILSPFKSKRKLIQIIICTFAFVGMAVPFKVMVLVEGMTEVRPVNAIPVVVGLLFGPAGAWGCAIGNLISDFFGTFSKASVLGFIGNFIAAYLPYKLWHFLKNGEAPNVKSYKNIALYVLISAMSSMAVSIFIVCGLDVFFKFWSFDIFKIILLNNFCFPIFLGLPVFIVLTCEDNNIRPSMPVVAGNNKYRIFTASFLMLSQCAITLLIFLGYSMSGFVPLGICGLVFLLSLGEVLLAP